MESTIVPSLIEELLTPQEERLEVIKKSGKLRIGLPKEVCFDEKSIALTPDAIQVLVKYGYEICVETGAGQGAFFSDLEYSEAGALIVDKKTAFEQDLVLKINPPTEKEIELMKPNSYLISALQVNLRNEEYFKKLSEKKINAIAFEFIGDENKEHSLVKLIGEISGRASVLYASELLVLSKGLMLGGITGVRPTEIVVLGAGIVGEYAVKTAIGLGAMVKVFDNSLPKLRKLQDVVGRPISTSMIDPKELTKSLRRADVLIGALSRVNSSPVITEEMVCLMKKGSVIIDLAVGSGKCVETTEITNDKNPYTEKYGVLHCGLPNLTSKISRTTSRAISNFFLGYFLENHMNEGIEHLLMKNEIRESFYVYKGRFTKKMICDKYNLKFNDINLLLF
ncbi:MAG: alanine dehydrogenase [Flavobacteriaceae bacterium]|nr:alanine dehydrogenase [Flavobacteriaceae bacterium]